jgi:hypothetical protein
MLLSSFDISVGLVDSTMVSWVLCVFFSTFVPDIVVKNNSRVLISPPAIVAPISFVVPLPKSTNSPSGFSPSSISKLGCFVGQIMVLLYSPISFNVVPINSFGVVRINDGIEEEIDG